MTITVDEALATVGVSPIDVLRAGGAVLDAGDAYLVGSLAQGFGNRGSDIDLHLFTADVRAVTAPYLFFVGDVPVDVEHMPADLVDVLVADLSSDVRTTHAGAVALAAAPTARVRKLLTRWFTALPLLVDQPTLLSELDRIRLVPHLVRGILERVVLTAAVAEIVSAAGRDAGYLWSRCQDAVLDLMCTARGCMPAGEKWLSSRAELVLSAVERRRVSRIDSSPELRRIPSLPAGVDPLGAVRLRRDDDLLTQSIGRSRFYLTRHGRLEPERELVEGGVRQRLSNQANEIVDQLRLGLVRLEVDQPVLTGMLRDVA